MPCAQKFGLTRQTETAGAFLDIDHGRVRFKIKQSQVCHGDAAGVNEILGGQVRLGAGLERDVRELFQESRNSGHLVFRCVEPAVGIERRNVLFQEPFFHMLIFIQDGNADSHGEELQPAGIVQHKTGVLDTQLSRNDRVDPEYALVFREAAVD